VMAVMMATAQNPCASAHSLVGVPTTPRQIQQR
jgi:hypothetical protein